MGRQADQTLQYWQHESGMYDDPKMVALNNKYGPLGEAVFERILDAIIKSNGYYALLNEQLITYLYRSVGGKWVKDLAVVSKIIQYCGVCGLFDINLLTQSVITSRGIQRRWLDVKKKNRARGYSTAEFWLLGDERQDMPESCNNGNSCSNNTDKCSNNADKCSNNYDIRQDKTSNNDDVIKSNTYNCQRARTRDEWREFIETTGNASYMREIFYETVGSFEVVDIVIDALVDFFDSGADIKIGTFTYPYKYICEVVEKTTANVFMTVAENFYEPNKATGKLERKAISKPLNYVVKALIANFER